MNRIKTVALDSFKKQIKSAAYWAMVLVPVIVMLVPALLGYFLGDSEGAGGSGGGGYTLVAEESLRPYLPEEGFKLTSEDEAAKNLEDEKIDSYAKMDIEDGHLKVVFEVREMNPGAIAQVRALATEVQNAINISEAGLDEGQIQLFTRTPDIKINQKDAGEGLLMYASYFILLMFMYFMLILYSNSLVVEIATEKGSKMIEFIFSSVKPKDYFAGKILGNFLAIILHTLIYIGLGVIAYFIARSKGVFDMININLSLGGERLAMVGEIGAMIIISLVAYMLVAAMLGSMANRQEDASKVATPLMVTIIGAFLVAMFFMNRPINNLVRAVSYVPYISVFFMPLRMIKADAGLIQGGIAIGILILATYLTYRFASRVYKKHILNYSSTSFFEKKFSKKK